MNHSELRGFYALEHKTNDEAEIDAWIESVSLHEAGHFVMAVVVGGHPKRATIEPDEHTLGRVDPGIVDALDGRYSLQEIATAAILSDFAGSVAANLEGYEDDQFVYGYWDKGDMFSTSPTNDRHRIDLSLDMAWFPSDWEDVYGELYDLTWKIMRRKAIRRRVHFVAGELRKRITFDADMIASSAREVRKGLRVNLDEILKMHGRIE